MSDNFFNEFNKIFGLVSNNFNRPVKDMQPYNIFKQDKGYIIVVNTLGIKREDLDIEIVEEKGRPFPVLRIKGKTAMENINFENSVNFGITLNIQEDIDELAYETKDGLTIIYLKLKQEKKQKMIAKFIENPDDFKF